MSGARPSGAQHLRCGRRAARMPSRRLQAVARQRAAIGEQPELQLFLAIDHDREQLERNVVGHRARRSGACAAGRRAARRSGRRCARRDRSAPDSTAAGSGSAAASPRRPRRARPGARDVGAPRAVVPDARERLVVQLAARLAGAHAPVDLLVVREVRLVEQADARQRLRRRSAGCSRSPRPPARTRSKPSPGSAFTPTAGARGRGR